MKVVCTVNCNVLYLYICWHKETCLFLCFVAYEVWIFIYLNVLLHMIYVYLSVPLHCWIWHSFIPIFCCIWRIRYLCSCVLLHMTFAYSSISVSCCIWRIGINQSLCCSIKHISIDLSLRSFHMTNKYYFFVAYCA